MNLLERTWHPVARVADVESAGARPLAVELLGRRLVVFATADGMATVDAACPHRGTDLALGDVVDGCVRCPYHGWRFDPDGTCVHAPALGDQRPPASTATRAHRTVVADGLVWASLDPHADAAEVVTLPSTPDGMRTVVGEPMVWATSAGRHLENILDLAHFPFVHPASFGCAEAETVEPHDVVRTATGVTSSVGVTTRNPGAPDTPMYAGLGDMIRIGYRYEVTIPYRISLHFDFPDGMRRALHEVITPNRRDRCTIHWRLHVDERLTSSDEEELAFAHQVFAEDCPIIESQPPGLPLEPTAEHHLPADRLAVAYRRCLREAGLTSDDGV